MNCAIKVHHVDGRNETLTDEPLYSVDRMSSVVNVVARQLRVNPECVYAELIINDEVRVFPFDVSFDRAFDSVFKSKDIYENRCTPTDYNK